MSTKDLEVGSEPTAERKTRSKDIVKRIKNSSGNVSVLVAFILLCITISIFSPYFLTARNLMNIGSYASIMGTMAAGLTVAMLVGGMDVSQYSLAAMTGMVAGLMIERGDHPGLVIIVSLGIGAVGGSINGFAITKMKLNPIIATMGTMSIFRGGAYLVSNGRYLRINEPVFNFIGKGRLLGIPFSIISMAVVYVLIDSMLKYMKFGRDVFAVGGNSTATRLAGINNDRIRFISFVISGIAAALGGILMISQTASAMPTHGVGNDLNGIAAVVLGGISLSGGRGNVFGTLIGILILATLVNGMTLLNIQAYWQMVVKGLVLVLAVYVDTLRGRGYK